MGVLARLGRGPSCHRGLPYAAMHTFDHRHRSPNRDAGVGSAYSATGAPLPLAPATLVGMTTHPLTREERSDLMRLALREAPEAAGLLWLMLEDNPRAGWRTVLVADNYVYRSDEYGFNDRWVKGRLADLERAKVIRSVVVSGKDGSLYGVDEYQLVKPG